MHRWPVRLRVGLFALVWALVGCARNEPTPTPSSTASTSGGEAETEPEAPIVPHGTPIPVPPPGVPRERLSTPLQRVWLEVEDAIAVRPPEGPEVGTYEAVTAWAQGPFRAWIEERMRETNEAVALMHELGEADLLERGMGTALLGYLYEDMAASVRGAPIPAEIAADAELLEVYTGAMQQALAPVARLAAEAFSGCVQLFTAAADPAWEPWAPYCAQHVEDLEEAFGVTPTPAPAAGAAPPAAGAAEPAPRATTAQPASGPTSQGPASEVTPSQAPGSSRARRAR